MHIGCVSFNSSFNRSLCDQQHLSFKPQNRTKYKTDYWKFNAELLKDKESVKIVKDLRRKFKKTGVYVAVAADGNSLNVRFGILTVEYSKSICRHQKQYETQLVQCPSVSLSVYHLFINKFSMTGNSYTIFNPHMVPIQGMDGERYLVNYTCIR